MADGKSWDAVVDALDGREYVLDGIHGTIKVERNPSALHGGLLLLKVSHEPSAKGQRTAAYQELRHQMGDDWNTDLTNSERLVDIALALGAA